MNTLPPVDAQQLADRLASLLGEERSVLVEFLRDLACFEADSLYAGFGYRSLFAYCTDRLRLSKSATFRRITTARLMKRFPIIEDFLADGRLCLTRVCILKDVLTTENHKDLLERAAAGSEDDVEVLVATLRPKPTFADSVRKVPVRRQTLAPAVGSGAEPMCGSSSSRALSRSGSGAEPIRDSSSSLALGGSGSGAEPTSGQSSSDALRGNGSGAELNRDASLALGATGSGAEPTSGPSSSGALGGNGSGAELIRDSSPSLTLGASSSGAEPIGATHPRAGRRSRMEVEPLNATMYAVKICVDRAFLDELDAVKAALSHKFPNGNFEDVLRECFRITLEACERRRCGSERRKPADESTQMVESGSQNEPPVEDRRSASSAESDASAASSPASRYIPVKVRRKVWSRDGGRCAFVSADGKRCGSNWQVDFHHCDPYATGGPPTVENLSLRCRTHNIYEAELAFGPEFMRSRVAEARGRRAPSVPPRNRAGSAPSRPTDDAH